MGWLTPFLIGAVVGFALFVFLAVKMANKRKSVPATGPSTLDVMAERMRTIAHNADEPRASKIAQKALEEANLPLS